MPQIKIKIDNHEYTLFCETGEENELIKAAKIVDQKMLIFKDEKDIPITKKFLMISLLLANDLLQHESSELQLNEIDNLIRKIESLL